MRLWKIFSASAVAVLGMACASQGSVIPLTPLVNTYVDKSSPKSNFSAATQGLLKIAFDIARVRFVYTEFDTSSYTPASVASATLTFTVSTAPSGSTASHDNYTLFGINDGLAATGTNEGEAFDGAAVYNNDGAGKTAPGFGHAPLIGPDDTDIANPALAYNLSNVTNLGTVTEANNIAAGSAIAFSDPSIATFLQADTNNVASFILVRSTYDPASTSVALNGNTTYAAPTLSVTTAVPEPAELGLISLGALGLLARRRTSLKSSR